MTVLRHPKSKSGVQRWKVNVYASKSSGGDGSRIVRVVTGPKSLALAVEAELLEQVRVSGAVKRREDARALTMDRLIEQWIEHGAPNWCARRPLDEGGRWRKHASPYIGSIRADRLAARDLDGIYHRMRTAGLGPRSVQMVHAQVSAAFNLAIRWGQVAQNPTTTAIPAKPKRRKYPMPAIETVTAAVDKLEADGDHFHALLVLMAATLARRRAELCALRWSDFDYENQTVTVTISRSVALDPSAETGWREMSKTKADTVTQIPLLPRVVDALEEHRKRQTELLEMLGGEFDPNGRVFLFLNQFGEVSELSPATLTQWWGRKRTSLGLDGVKWHDLRHWGASRLIASGADVLKVRDWLGHRSANTTDGYMHLFGGEDRTRLMNKAFGAFEAINASDPSGTIGEDELGTDDAAKLLQIASTMLAGGTLDPTVAASVKQLLNAEDATA